MARLEIEYTSEPDLGTQDQDDEQERISEDAQTRDTTRQKPILVGIIANEVTLNINIGNLVGHIANHVARDALKPELAVDDAEIVADPSTGGSDLDAKVKKVDKLLSKAESENANTENGAAKEGKFSKLIVALSALTATLPFLKDLFQLLVKAANGTLTAADIGDAADRALIIGLINDWKNETDTDFWTDVGNFYQVHNAGSAVTVAAGISKEDPTCADLCLILNLVSRLFPISPTKPFSWSTAQDKSDAITNLAGTLDASTLTGKVQFIQSLAALQYNSAALPRGMQAQLGSLAIAEAIMP